MQKAIKKFLSENKEILFIVLASLLIRIYYVFYCCDYKTYLFSDMGGYWNRAVSKFNGDNFSMMQWTSWAPFFHFYLFFIFKIAYFFNFKNNWLEIVISLNIVLAVISVICFYFLANHVLENKKLSLLATLFYGFSYPLIYLNALVMSENFAIPVLVISVFLLFYSKDNIGLMFLSGLFLGLSVAARPALGVVALFYFLYIVLLNKLSVKSIINGVIFVAGFLLVIFLLLVEINYISYGQQRSLSGNSGVNFFIQQCKPRIVKSSSMGINTNIASVNYISDYKLEEFLTDHPMHDQKYFYELGLDCIKKNPNIWIENLFEFEKMLFGPLFPEASTAKGFKIFIKISNYLIFFMILSFGFLYYLFKEYKTDRKKILFLLSIPLSIMLVSYFYVAEQRYLFPAYFAIYLVFFYVLSKVKRYKPYFVNYSLVIILLFLLYKALNILI